MKVSSSLNSYGGKIRYPSRRWPVTPVYKGVNKVDAPLLHLSPIVHKPLLSLCNWMSACWPYMLHWFRYLKLRLSAFIKMGRGLGVALTWRVWHQTPGTFPCVLRSTDTRLMGSDRLSERKMLMNEHVSKMLLVLHWYYQRVWGSDVCGRWLNTQGSWWRM